jgi:hypothetical protein
MNKSKLIRIARNHQGDFRLFIDKLGLSQDFKVKIGIGEMEDFPETRNVAYTAQVSPKEFQIVFAPKWKQLTDSNYIAVLRHEYGHVLHLMYPQIFKTFEKKGYRFHPSQEEIFSDFAALVIWGQLIFYDEDLIQTIDKTPIESRPRHLGW